RLDSISGGSEALCEVTIKVEDPYGNQASAKSVGEDIVITSVQAMIDGINRIMLKKILKQKNLGQ
ncbi:alpha-isopropylmalate synthase regulatory domain-containing protein, partial [Candidatus Nitrosotalea sp. FS]